MPMWTFKPILRQTIWGGERLAKIKEIDSAPRGIGESWEISGLKGMESVVADGPDEGLTITQLIKKYGSWLMGDRNWLLYKGQFPLLIKLIDADSNLSVQVHPDEEMATQNGLPNGKTEMWYVMDAEKEARVIGGFSRPVTPEELHSLSSHGRIEDVLRYIDSAPGKVFYIPGGRLHSLGKGNLVLEIQQASDTTYRFYDFGRLDLRGQPRPLQLKEAISTVNCEDVDCQPIEYQLQHNMPVRVIRCPYFTFNLLCTDSSVMRDYSEWDTFVVISALQGEGEVSCGDECVKLKAGHSLLVPASSKGVVFTPISHTFLCSETFIS